MLCALVSAPFKAPGPDVPLRRATDSDKTMSLKAMQPNGLGPGTTIVQRKNFEIVELMAEGGMGQVYKAYDPSMDRYIALKILKPGMDTRQVVARFEAERQALALMDHPNIAKVLDAGTISDFRLQNADCKSEISNLPPAIGRGRPYFVMELVRGVPITRFCDDNRLAPRARLELFTTVCQAVQHAHQKGIIHRDLKPTNVLVTLHDGTPVVKVIDFGIAKALGQRLTDKTLFTGFAQMIGSPSFPLCPSSHPSLMGMLGIMDKVDAPTGRVGREVSFFVLHYACVSTAMNGRLRYSSL